MAISSLAPHLSKQEGREALVFARGIYESADRAQAFSSLVPYLGEEERCVAVDEADGNPADRGDSILAGPLSSLVPYLDEAAQRKALEAVRKFVNERPRVQILSSPAPHLDEAAPRGVGLGAGHHGRPSPGTIIDFARTAIGRGRAAPWVVAKNFQRLGGFRTVMLRMRVLTSLESVAHAEMLTEWRGLLGLTWTVLLRQKALMSRRSLLENLSTVSAKSLVLLGGSGFVNHLTRSMITVSRWWP